jgi:hypothetical protein
MKYTDRPEWKQLQAKLGNEELMNRLMWLGSTAREFEREFGRKPTAEDWKDIQAVLGGEHD